MCRALRLVHFLVAFSAVCYRVRGLTQPFTCSNQLAAEDGELLLLLALGLRFQPSQPLQEGQAEPRSLICYPPPQLPRR